MLINRIMVYYSDQAYTVGYVMLTVVWHLSKSNQIAFNSDNKVHTKTGITKYSGTEAPSIWAMGLMQYISPSIIHVFDQLHLRKIIKFVAARCHILRLKCTKFDFGWGFVRDLNCPLGSLQCSRKPLAGFKGPTSRSGEGKIRKGAEGAIFSPLLNISLKLAPLTR